MRRTLGLVWLAVIAGVLGWSVRTVPAPSLGAVPTLTTVDEHALPAPQRLRATHVSVGLDLRGRPAEGGSGAHLLPSRVSGAGTRAVWLVLEPETPLAGIRAAAGALPYFPTGPPPIA
jgi:hypothetical protein